MSQGQKQCPEPSLFVQCTRIYEHIPKAHFYEQLNRVLDLEFVRELTKPLYAERNGRPSLDPVVFFKCMLVAFFENILGDTELEYRLADSLTLRRFLGYGLEERTPDESTLRKTRQRMPEDMFQVVFARVLKLCDQHGLVKGQALGTDGTAIDANASMDSLLHKELGCTYEEFMLALRRQDKPEATKEQAKQADRERSHKARNSDWESPGDPSARIAKHADKHTHLSFGVHTTVDLETGVIMAAGADPANLSDQQAFLGRVDEGVAAAAELGKQTQVIVADKGHHSGENLIGIEERELVGLIASPQKRQGPEGFQREDFRYDAGKDQYLCPAGAVLERKEWRNRESRIYQAKVATCQSCPHFGVCTKNKSGRRLTISHHEEQIQANRERVYSEAARPLMQIRRQRGEAPFAYFKGYGGLRRFSGRGLEYAQKKTLIAGAGWNLLLLVKRLMRAGAPKVVICALIVALQHVLRGPMRPAGARDPATTESRSITAPLLA